MSALNNAHHLSFMRMALYEAKKCMATPTAFCVGCVITSSFSHSPMVISTGYSRELAGNTHAEANALTKLQALPSHELAESMGLDKHAKLVDILAEADVYTTMEPCSVRTSGLAPCSDALIAAKIKRCFIGVAEPADFVVCEGAQKLKDAGIDVVWLSGLEQECLQEARRGHTAS